MEKNDFYTFNGYMKKDDNALTASMEDYLEMIYRLSLNTGFTRINELSDALNVQPPSATKMVQKMGELGLLKYEKYGYIMLETSGKKLGKILLKRHNTIEEFLKILGVSSSQLLSETEKIEHTISNTSISLFEIFVSFIKDNPDIISRYNAYKEK